LLNKKASILIENQRNDIFFANQEKSGGYPQYE